jgi:hypothetical protein
MSQSRSLFALAVAAAAALSANTFITAGGAVATAAGNAFGVARTDGAIGDLVPTDVLGTAQVIASAAIAKGAFVQVATGGKAVTYSTGVAVGIALEAAAAAGDVIEVYLLPNCPLAA